MGRLETAAKNAAILYMFAAYHGGPNGRSTLKIPKRQKEKINALVEKWLGGNYSGRSLDRQVEKVIGDAHVVFRKKFTATLLGRRFDLTPVVNELLAQFPTDEQMLGGVRFVLTEMGRLAEDSGGSTQNTAWAQRVVQEHVDDHLTAGTRGGLFE